VVVIGVLFVGDVAVSGDLSEILHGGGDIPCRELMDVRVSECLGDGPVEDAQVDAETIRDSCDELRIGCRVQRVRDVIDTDVGMTRSYAREISRTDSKPSMSRLI
jgi:hypothetical protein